MIFDLIFLSVLFKLVMCELNKVMNFNLLLLLMGMIICLLIICLLESSLVVILILYFTFPELLIAL